MNYDEFIGQVQYRAELGSRGEAVRATRATLQTLGNRLQTDEADDLASVLPVEIDRFLTTADSGQSFGYGEFVERVAKHAKADKPRRRDSTRGSSWTSSMMRSRQENARMSNPSCPASSGTCSTSPRPEAATSEEGYKR